MRNGDVVQRVTYHTRHVRLPRLLASAPLPDARHTRYTRYFPLQMTVKIASVIHVSSPSVRRAALLEVHPDGASARVDNALSKLLALGILLPVPRCDGLRQSVTGGGGWNGTET